MAAESETDFSTMSDAEVISMAKQARLDAEKARDQHLRQLGLACADLNRRGWTWEQIGREMNVNLTTAYRWAQPYL